MNKNIEQKPKKNLTIKIVSAFLILLAFLYVFIIINTKNYSLVSGVIGIVLLILTMNIANVIKINKEKVKLFSIISIVLCIISIPLVFKQIIFSYVLVVPAFIFSKRAMQKDSRQVLTKISFFLSALMLVFYLAFSIIGGISNVITISK